MPWSKGNYPTAFKNLKKDQRALAIAIANGVYKKCIAGGNTDKVCAPKAIRIALSKVKESNMPDTNIEEKYINRRWDNAESDYTVEQLSRAVPKAILAWAKSRAKDGRVIKDDLKLRYKEPNGDINLQGIQAALRRSGQTKGIPQDVLAAAIKELRNALSKAKAALGIKETSLSIETTLEEGAQVVYEGDRELYNVPATLIRAGWSLNDRYYSPKVLAASAPLFEGLGSFDGHIKNPKVTDYLGLFKNVYWDAAKQAIRGTYTIFDPRLGRIAEAAPHLVKLSISAMGNLVEGEAQGRSGLIVEEITAARSCDAVVSAGAGGGLNTVFEAATKSKEEHMEIKNVSDLKEAYPNLVNKLEESIRASVREDSQIKALQEELKDKEKALSEEVAKREEAERRLAILESSSIVEAALTNAELPLPAANRIRALFEGEVATEESVKQAIQAEKDYLKALSEEIPVQGVKQEGDPLEEANREAQDRLRKLFGLVDKEEK